MSSNRTHLKMRLLRELVLWGLYSLDSRLEDEHINPFDASSFEGDLWQGDVDLWRLYFGHVKPKERIQKLWAKDQIWSMRSDRMVEIISYRSSIDALISKCSHNWRIERMGSIDRNIIRMACYELCFEDNIPARAILNEAIELGKRYGSADSARFINGLLDRIAQELGRVARRTRQKPQVQISEIKRQR